MTTLLTEAATPAGHACAGALSDRYRAVRTASTALASPLSPEDCQAQSMESASPVKWHLAHTTWFFETFILQSHLPGYESFHPDFSFLFNSYYNQVGDRIARSARGLMTRPPMDEVLAYRRSIDEAMSRVFAEHTLVSSLASIIEIGLQHEQQHQELLLTDVKHLLSRNPLRPAYRADAAGRAADGDVSPIRWLAVDEGVQNIGFNGEGFFFDNEQPRHRVYIEPVAIADRLITTGEFLEFMQDGGYARPELWLDQGWAIVQKKRWRAPLYWCDNDPHGWRVFTLGGERDVDPSEPVSHVSFFEADAYARWANARLATEAEWEVCSSAAAEEGNFVESDRLQPAPANATAQASGGPRQMFGDVWEWTGSQYRPYPGYRPPTGAIGEYNGKFMSNQFVLRGGSCATPRSHIRRTYRNFFSPESRWQFTGIRLAKEQP